MCETHGFQRKTLARTFIRSSLANYRISRNSRIISRGEGWSCPVRIRVTANQLQHTLTKTLGEGWSFHWWCFTAYPQILLYQRRPSEMRVYSAVNPADMNLYFIDGTDSWTASLCLWICGRICHQPNYRTPYRWLSTRGPSKTAPSACGTRWTTKRGEFTIPCASVDGRTRGHPAIPLDLTEDLIFVLQDIWFDFKSQSKQIVQASPCREIFNFS